MIGPIRFSKHGLFQRTAGAMVVATALAGLAAAVAFSLAGGGAWHYVLVLPALLAVVAGVSAARVQKLSKRQTALRGLIIAAGGVALVFAPANLFVPAVIAFAGCVGVGFAVGSSRLRMLASVGLGVGVALVACHVFDATLFSTELSSTPAWLKGAAAGIGFALVMPLALLARHVMPMGDVVDRKYRSAAKADDEVATLAARSYKLWRNADAELDDDDANRQVLQEAVERVLDAAGSWQSVSEGANATRAADLDTRIAVMEAKQEAASDDQVRAELSNALKALVKQRDYLRDISSQRERIIARMHSYVATLEQLRLAMVTVESTKASQQSPELALLLGELESVELSHA